MDASDEIVLEEYDLSYFSEPEQETSISPRIPATQTNTSSDSFPTPTLVRKPITWSPDRSAEPSLPPHGVLPISAQKWTMGNALMDQNSQVEQCAPGPSSVTPLQESRYLGTELSYLSNCTFSAVVARAVYKITKKTHK